MSTSLGEAFATAVGTKDHAQVRELLHDELDFRAMTPGRIWEAESPDDVVSALQIWFGDDDSIESVAISSDAFADCERVAYRLGISNPDGPHLVEQQAYLRERDGKIGWLRIMCSGYRPNP